jgi:16S rRNA processing protein RimM
MTAVLVGRIGRAHGVRGEVALDGCHLTPSELHATRRFTWSKRGGISRSLVLEAVRPIHARMLARFEGIHDRDAAAALGGGLLFAEAAALPDPGPGVVYTFQLVGFAVVAEDGRSIGTLESVIATGAHPVYVVRGPAIGGGPGPEWMIPAHPEFLKRVDVDARTIVMSPPAGFDRLG